ncbi:DNA primase [Streptomyces hirsutus]|uniref:DNA primase n=1 Tax=Streptomyces hirsutus TaxID=35620 RepID=UPI00386D4C3C|nr:DNA primase [Streptomyces hirsutus]
MNRTALGLAIGAGYFLGRTKKLKAAVAVGGLVAGKKLNLGPRMITDLVSKQLQNNPQFKELGDQLRGDLRGAGKAASGALVERQLNSLAGKLHGRTAEMRDQLTGVAGRPDREDDGYDEDEYDEKAGDDEPDGEEPEPPPERPSKRAPSKEAAKKALAKKTPAKKAPAKKAPAKKAPTGKAAPAKRAAAKKTAGKKTTAARTASSRGTRSRTAKGGGE